MTAKEIYEAAQMFFPPPPMPTVLASDIDQAPDCSGVYFLYSNNVLMYVGESLSIRKRLVRHQHKGKFDSFGWLRCDPAQRKRLESFYIGVLDPFLNHESTSAAVTRSEAKRPVFQRGSLVRRLLRFIALHPGCTKTQLHKHVGWNKGAQDVNRVLDRMREWKLIHIEAVPTAGRTKHTFFCSTT